MYITKGKTIYQNSDGTWHIRIKEEEVMIKEYCLKIWEVMKKLERNLTILNFKNSVTVSETSLMLNICVQNKKRTTKVSYLLKQVDDCVVCLNTK